MINGFGSLDYDHIVIRNKTFLTYVVCQDFDVPLNQIQEVFVPRAKLRSWSIANKIFGPVPLSLMLYTADGLYAKRLSLCWSSEYGMRGDNCLIPVENFVKLQSSD